MDKSNISDAWYGRNFQILYFVANSVLDSAIEESAPGGRPDKLDHDRKSKLAKISLEQAGKRERNENDKSFCKHYDFTLIC